MFDISCFGLMIYTRFHTSTPPLIYRMREMRMTEKMLTYFGMVISS